MHKTSGSQTIRQLSSAAMLLLVSLVGGLLWLRPWQDLDRAGLALGQLAQTSENAPMKAGAKLGKQLTPEPSNLGKSLGTTLAQFSEKTTLTRSQSPLRGSQVQAGVRSPGLVLKGQDLARRI